MSRGEYILALNHDTVAEPNFVSRLIEVMEEDYSYQSEQGNKADYSSVKSEPIHLSKTNQTYHQPVSSKPEITTISHHQANARIDEELRELIAGQKTRIKVIGTGGAGNNTINRKRCPADFITNL